MIDPLVATTVAFIPPYLGKAGEEAAKTVGKEGALAGLKVLGWLRGKVTGRAKEALADVEENPDDDHQAALRVQLAKLLKAEPGLLEELRALLPTGAGEAGGQTMTLGDGSKAVQNTGHGSTISIS